MSDAPATEEVAGASFRRAVIRERRIGNAAKSVLSTSQIPSPDVVSCHE